MKRKSNYHSKNGNTIKLFEFNLNKSVSDSHYNSLVAIMSMIMMLSLVATSIVGIIFFRAKPKAVKIRKG